MVMNFLRRFLKRGLNDDLTRQKTFLTISIIIRKFNSDSLSARTTDFFFRGHHFDFLQKIKMMTSITRKPVVRTDKK
jgi:hypothetical protein